MKRMTRHPADLVWWCRYCRRDIWRGAFRHICAGGQIVQHSHEVDLWREANPDMPCPCHEWGVGDLMWGTFPSGATPRALILPGGR